MPIYDYVCGVCGDRTEVIHGIDAPAPRFCPACGAEGTLRKAFVVPTVHFKGSGWAKKDRSKVSRSAAKADGDGAAAGADSGADSSSDTGSSDGAGKAGDKPDGEKSPASAEKKAPASGDASTASSKSGSAAEGGKSGSKASRAGTD